MTLEEQFLSYLKNERSYSPKTVLAYQKDLAAAKKFWQENGGFPAGIKYPAGTWKFTCWQPGKSWHPALYLENYPALSLFTDF